ncbi:unnamed protein product [Caenorhabditis nigoni]
MSDSEEKEFRISHAFNNSTLQNCEGTFGDNVEHFGVKWRVRIYRNTEGNVLPDLVCEGSPTDDLAKMLLETERNQKSMKFDDDVATESSDVVLVVADQKFYLSKLYLSFHSTYFKTLFSGNFSESQKSEIELKDINPDDFQNFLEMLYGERYIDDETCSQMLSLSDYFGAKTVIRRCEDFLINASKKPLKEKFEAAVQYKMDKLTKKCIFEMKTREEIRSMIPEDPNEMDK